MKRTRIPLLALSAALLTPCGTPVTAEEEVVLAKAIELFNANQSRFDAEIALAAAQLALRQGELDLRAALGLFPVEGVP